MAKPCEICGDTGFVACIRVCCKCKITREHPYCMKVVHEGDPDTWVCDECVLGAPIPSSKPVPIRDPGNAGLRSNIRKPPRNTKVQYISPEEAMVLESGAQKKIFSSPSKLNRSAAVPPKFSVKPASRDWPPGFTKPQSARSPPNTSRDKVLSKDINLFNDKGPARQLYKETSTRTPLPSKSVPKSNAEKIAENSGHAPMQSVQNKPAKSSGAPMQSVQNIPAKSSGAPMQSVQNIPAKSSGAPMQSIQNIPAKSSGAPMQSVQNIPAKSSDKGPIRQLRGDTSAGMTLHPENVRKSDKKTVTEQSGHTSRPLLQSLSNVNSDISPVRKLNKDSGMTLQLEKTPKSNSEIVIANSENASLQSLKQLPAPSSDKSPVRKLHSDSGVTLQLEKTPKSNSEIVIASSENTSLQSPRQLLTPSSDKSPVRKLDGDSGVTLQLEKTPKPNSEIVIASSENASLQSPKQLLAPSSDKSPVRKLDKHAGVTLQLEKSPIYNSEIVIANSENTSLQSPKRLPAPSSGMHADSQRQNVGSEGRESLGLLELDRYLLNHPAEFPTWKGRFKITQEDDILRCRSFDRIQAHPPCKVHRKAYNLSKQLPETLHFELLPRLNFWGSLFKDDAPTALDIGLYFRSPKSSSLLNFLDKDDKLLRCQIDSVELFVFSSRHLPEDSQKINGEFFLWGIFRSLEDAIEASRSQLSEDMVIDMAGGTEVGTIDMVVPRPTEDDRADSIVLEVTPVKIKSPDSIEPVLPLLSSSLQNELEFEKELQKCFDSFAMLEQVEVKEEVGSPSSR